MRSQADDRRFLGSVLASVAALALLAASGCTSGAKSGGADTQDADGAGVHIDVGCMLGRVEKPTESFHYSYKYSDASQSVDAEADVTPEAVDIVVKGTSGSRSLHATRSDENSWNNALLSLSSLAFTGMTGRLAGLEGMSAIVNRGAEPVNGYQATKYSIDTTSANSSDKQTIETLFGAGSYDRGTVWMGQDGCAVKLILDEGIVFPNGVQKRHYEIARIKK
ncbi:MAG TPA: hypothetical protein VGR84_17890 [Candidatus Acidoferrales bacterium]|nr:hypothetical protein [Candidatus Acidoferrales bacterium]